VRLSGAQGRGQTVMQIMLRDHFSSFRFWFVCSHFVSNLLLAVALSCMAIELLFFHSHEGEKAMVVRKGKEQSKAVQTLLASIIIQ
jgi:hypothetical protein